MHSPSLDEWAHDIGQWRREKQFFTPDLRLPDAIPVIEDPAYNPPCSLPGGVRPFLTNADAMLGKLMLVVSECAEAAEAVRKGEYANFGEEIADAVIRLLDIADASGLDLTELIRAKMHKNWQRPIKHGKKTNL